jgi:hypothetical protein
MRNVYLSSASGKTEEPHQRVQHHHISWNTKESILGGTLVLEVLTGDNKAFPGTLYLCYESCRRGQVITLDTSSRG